MVCSRLSVCSESVSLASVTHWRTCRDPEAGGGDGIHVSRGLPPPSRLVAKELPAMANVSLSWRRGGGKHGELPRSSITATQRKSKESVPVAAIGHAPCCTVGY